jgi:hypothetical protein
MKRFGSFAVVVAVGVCLMMVGCAKEPVQEIAAAQAAMAAAKTAQAYKYVSKEFAAAADSLKAVLSEVQKQNAASPLGRNYEKAKARLASVAATAATLRVKAETEKARVQAEAESALEKLNSAAAEARELVKKAPKKGKEAKALFEAKAKQIEAAAAKAAEIQKLKINGDFVAARDAANGALAGIEAIKAELTAAIEKAAPKAKGKKK